MFEDFLTYSFRRYQNDYAVIRQGPQRPLARLDDRDAFTMKPDLSLWAGNRVAFILDAKWKRIDTRGEDPKHGIDQNDMYQFYAYAKAYECDVVALVYPRTQIFKCPLHYRFFDDFGLICLPFDVQDPKGSVRTSIKALYEFGP